MTRSIIFAGSQPGILETNCRDHLLMNFSRGPGRYLLPLHLSIVFHHFGVIICWMITHVVAEMINKISFTKAYHPEPNRCFFLYSSRSCYLPVTVFSCDPAGSFYYPLCFIDDGRFIWSNVFFPVDVTPQIISMIYVGMIEMQMETVPLLKFLLTKG